METPLTVVVVAAAASSLASWDRLGLALRLTLSCVLGSGLGVESVLEVESEPSSGFPINPSRLMGNFCSFIGCLVAGGGRFGRGGWTVSHGREELEEEVEEEEEKEGSLLMVLLVFARSKLLFWPLELQAVVE